MLICANDPHLHPSLFLQLLRTHPLCSYDENTVHVWDFKEYEHTKKQIQKHFRFAKIAPPLWFNNDFQLRACPELVSLWIQLSIICIFTFCNQWLLCYGKQTLPNLALGNTTVQTQIQSMTKSISKAYLPTSSERSICAAIVNSCRSANSSCHLFSMTSSLEEHLSI